MLHKTLLYGPGGHYAEVYDDTSEWYGHWYGTRQACEDVDPESVTLYPPVDARPDQFDLACERRHD